MNHFNRLENVYVFTQATAFLSSKYNRSNKNTYIPYTTPTPDEVTNTYRDVAKHKHLQDEKHLH